MGKRRILACILGGLALASCTTSSTTRTEATDANFAEVSAGEDWNDVAARISGCDDAEDIEAFAEYLRDSNPIVGDVGLTAGQVVAFDSDRADIDGCSFDNSDTGTASVETAEEPESEAPAAADETDETAETSEESESEAPVASADEVQDLVATPDQPDAAASASAGPAPGPNPNLTTVFEEDFALASSMARFDLQVFHAVPFHGTPDTWQGDHDLSCGAPTTTRTIQNPITETSFSSDVGDTAYWCDPAPGKEHLMTSFNTFGYSHLDFAPSQSFESVSRVCWDQNMNDLGRKWTQLSVISEERFQANNARLDYVLPSLADGPGKRGMQLADDDFLFKMIEGTPTVRVGADGHDKANSTFTTMDKARRYRTCIEDLENGTIQVELERDSSIEVIILNGAMPEGAARVIFQDVTYNATKRPSPLEDPFTWHWDNISIQTR